MRYLFQSSPKPSSFPIVSLRRRLRFFYAASDRLRYKDRQESDAEMKYREVMQATGNYGVFYHLAQGQIYSMRGNLDDALTEFEIASEINEQSDIENQVISVYINLGLTYRKLSGRYYNLNLTDEAKRMAEESLEVLKQAFTIAPNDTGVLNALAKTSCDSAFQRPLLVKSLID